MRAYFTLVRKQLVESRWMLGLSSLALFAFGWLGVFLVALGQIRMRRAVGGRSGLMERARAMAGAGAEITTGSFEMQFWMHPFVWLPVVVWAIGRSSLALAGELERGTLDLTLSRPVSRTNYLASQVTSACLGFLVMVGALVAGNLVGTRFNTGIEDPPAALALLRPASNFLALGFCVYGYTLIISSVDVVRWRATLVGSSLTIAGFAAWVVSLVPALSDSPWRTWLRRSSIFTAFNPVDAIGDAKDLSQNLAILGGIGLAGVVLAQILFSRRDLPASGG